MGDLLMGHQQVFSLFANFLGSLLNMAVAVNILGHCTSPSFSQPYH